MAPAVSVGERGFSTAFQALLRRACVQAGPGEHLAQARGVPGVADVTRFRVQVPADRARMGLALKPLP